jgi:hypothetical protein
MLPVVSPDCSCLSSGDTTGNIGKTRHRMKTKKTNPETQLATLGKQETGWRQTRTIRRHYWQHWENKTQDEDKQGQSKDTTGNIGKTRNRMKTNKDNPETQLATLGKQNTGWRQTRTIRRHYWQHWENKKQDEDRQGQPEDTTDNPMLPVVSPDCPCMSLSCVLFSQCCQ